jgi:hypothetical protein
MRVKHRRFFLFFFLGDDVPATTESDLVAPAEAARKAFANMFALGTSTRVLLDKLARTEATTLAIMHGSSYRGNGAKMLRDLADAMGA